MSPNSTPSTVATIGVDIGKNTFHLIGLDRRGAIDARLTDRFWMTMAWSAEATGRAANSGALDLANFQRYRVKIQFGLESSSSGREASGRPGLQSHRRR